MRLTEDELRAYEESGFLFRPSCYSAPEVGILKAELRKVFLEDSPRRVVEREQGIIRSVYGTHMTNEVFRRLARHPRIVEPARQILGSEVYIYQFKINAKAAFGGDVWEWHQDYIFWRREDGMPRDRVVSVAVFLDDVNEFNGPMYLIPGSHAEGVIEDKVQSKALATEVTPVYQGSPAWINNLTASLKYSLDKEIVACLVSKYGLTSVKGPAGSALFFHSNLVHASSNNISPFDRVAVIITFNSVENIPVPVAAPRPDFLVGRDTAPLIPVSDDALLSLD